MIKLKRKVRGGVLWKSFAFGLFVAVACLLVFVFITPDWYLMSGVPSSVDSAKIRSIDLGSDKSEVERVLGQPLDKFESRNYGLVSFYYSRPVPLAYVQPNVVFVFKDGFLEMIEIQRTALWGDEFDGYYYYKYRNSTLDSDDFERLFSRREKGVRAGQKGHVDNR